MKPQIGKALLVLSLLVSQLGHASFVGCASLAEIESWPVFDFKIQSAGQATIAASLVNRTAAFYLNDEFQQPRIVVGVIEETPQLTEGNFLIRLREGRHKIAGMGFRQMRLKPIAALTPAQVAKYSTWQKIEFRRANELRFPPVLKGMRAVFVLPDDSRNTFGVPCLEGVIEELPRWEDRTAPDETGVYGQFVLRLGNGRRETISWTVFDELKVDPPSVTPEIIQ